MLVNLFQIMAIEGRQPADIDLVFAHKAEADLLGQAREVFTPRRPY